MARYIDAEICRRRISDERTYDKRWNEALNRACRIVCEQPTVDAVPVVRCVECKYLDESLAMGGWDGSCRYWNTHSTVYSGFCSFGEKVTG